MKLCNITGQQMRVWFTKVTEDEEAAEEKTE